MEQWKPVVGYEEHYEVSSHGGVRNAITGKLICGEVNRDGHVRITLSNSGRKRFFLHRLMLMSFVGNAPENKPLALHNDGNPSNNIIGNLRWGSVSDNVRDAVKHGVHRNTRKTHCPSGHEYTPENTTIRALNGWRYCKKCNKILMSKRRVVNNATKVTSS